MRTDYEVKSPRAIKIAKATVGYKCPPSEHRFRKGCSGNPAGRPRKAAAPAASEGSNAVGLLLKDAYAPVAVTENGSRSEMTTIQAVVRRFKRAALTEDNVSARRYLSAVRLAQQRNKKEELHKIAVLAEYKRVWGCEIRRCSEEGEPEPNPLPHPDDIVIDELTGEVRFNGPVTDMEKAAWDQSELDRWHTIAMKAQIGTLYEAPQPRYHDSVIDDCIRQQVEKLAEIDRMYPAAETRRQPGFSLERWRAVKVKQPEANPRKARSRGKRNAATRGK